MESVTGACRSPSDRHQASIDETLLLEREPV